ncbi:hypothetical protein QYE76_028114 [Lolium multiflorum]|uniref:Protein FAR1-RELATED SEQUENCE n=1 Tax=Lolium multiflorum TaxID=4521 RepID=A0AAD8QKC9_LOLMU|nr:hypothetical protein QYE76_028114 [Lolium multiflorum]
MATSAACASSHLAPPSSAATCAGPAYSSALFATSVMSLRPYPRLLLAFRRPSMATVAAPQAAAVLVDEAPVQFDHVTTITRTERQPPPLSRRRRPGAAAAPHPPPPSHPRGATASRRPSPRRGTHSPGLSFERRHPLSSAASRHALLPSRDPSCPPQPRAAAAAPSSVAGIAWRFTAPSSPSPPPPLRHGDRRGSHWPIPSVSGISRSFAGIAGSIASVDVVYNQEDMADMSGDCKEYHEIVIKTFVSEEDGFNFYNSYALEKGFSVRRSYVEWDEANKEIILRKFVCSREGCREEKHMKRKRADMKRRPRNITRVGCKAKLVIARAEETGQWFVKDFIDVHTHKLAPGDIACLLRSHRRISAEQKADIIEMETAGIRKHKIMDVLRMQCGGFDKVGCTTRDIYNFCHQYKQETVADGDAQTVIRHMMAREERDPGFFFRYLVDKDDHLKGLFWCDSQSRLDYKAFGDVVVFDSTYRTNKYNLPFVPFVGLNHHRSTVIFGCGIISHETTEVYEWMLEVFSEAMSQKHPISVITDGDLAMQRAIRVIWSDSNHRLCVWHIQQNIVRHLSDDKVKEEFRSFIYDSSSIAEHESKWLDFLERNKVTSEESWLHQMYQMRKLWCAPYLAGRCFLGLSSNQRSESLNSVLHTHLSSQMTLFKMLEHYERCLSTRRLNDLVSCVCISH